jgi:hypothetical protein
MGNVLIVSWVAGTRPNDLTRRQAFPMRVRERDALGLGEAFLSFALGQSAYLRGTHLGYRPGGRVQLVQEFLAQGAAQARQQLPHQFTGHP